MLLLGKAIGLPCLGATSRCADDWDDVRIRAGAGALRRIDIDVPTASRGLTDTGAAARLVMDGPNELPATSGRGLVHRILEVLPEP